MKRIGFAISCGIMLFGLGSHVRAENHYGQELAVGARFEYPLCNINELISKISSIIPASKSQFETDTAFKEKKISIIRSHIPSSILKDIACVLYGGPMHMCLNTMQILVL